MAQNPCDLCGERFVGSAITGYHRWYNGSLRAAYKQRMCPKCAGTHYSNLQSGAVLVTDEEGSWPFTCARCDQNLDGDAAETWTTWYRGNNRKDTVLVLHEHCAANVRTLMMQGAERLEDRERAGVGAGGSPLPNPPGFGRKDDLPW